MGQRNALVVELAKWAFGCPTTDDVAMRESADAPNSKCSSRITRTPGNLDMSGQRCEGPGVHEVAGICSLVS
jgi:hypothetical protein